MAHLPFATLALSLLAVSISGCCCRGNSPPPPRLVPASEQLEKELAKEVKDKPSLIRKLCGKQDSKEYEHLREPTVKVTSAPGYDQIQVTISGQPYNNVEDPPATFNGKPFICAGTLLVAAYVLEKNSKSVEIESIKLKAVTTPGVSFDPDVDSTEFHTPSKPPTPSHRRHHHWG